MMKIFKATTFILGLLGQAFLLLCGFIGMGLVMADERPAKEIADTVMDAWDFKKKRKK